MSVPKKEGISRGREKKKKWEGSSSLGVFATRISAPRREFRARGANFGHVGRISDISDVLATAKFELCIFLKIYTIRIWRSLEHRKCPRFAPRARNSPRVPEIRVAAPRFALQRHRVMTNLPTFFSFLYPSKYLPFLEHSSRYYIYIIYITF